MDSEELAFDRKVEPDQLDVECCRQADVFYKWAERMAEAKAKLEQMEFDADVLAATLQLRVRKAPDAFGLETSTEAAIKAAVSTRPEFVELQQKIIQQRREVALLSHAVSAMDTKKKMLDLLVTLHGQEYFAGPGVPRDLVTSYREYQERRTEAANERQRQRVRRRA